MRTSTLTHIESGEYTSVLSLLHVEAIHAVGIHDVGTHDAETHGAEVSHVLSPLVEHKVLLLVHAHDQHCTDVLLLVFEAQEQQCPSSSARCLEEEHFFSAEDEPKINNYISIKIVPSLHCSFLILI